MIRSLSLSLLFMCVCVFIASYIAGEKHPYHSVLLSIFVTQNNIDTSLGGVILNLTPCYILVPIYYSPFVHIELIIHFHSLLSVKVPPIWANVIPHKCFSAVSLHTWGMMLKKETSVKKWFLTECTVRTFNVRGSWS